MVLARGQGGSGWPDADTCSRSSCSRRSCTRSRSPVAPARPGRPEVHPRRPPVPAGSLARRRSRHGPASRSIPHSIAAVEPVVRLFAGPGPDTWRIAAQVVAALASLAILFPLFGLTRSLFDERIACMAVAIYALLPVPAEVGHDTLSDSLGLLADPPVAPVGRHGDPRAATGDRPSPPGSPAGSVTWRAPKPSWRPPRWAWPGCSPGCDPGGFEPRWPHPPCRPWASRLWFSSAAMPW